MLQNIAELRLDSNQFTGTLPAAWSAWGSNTGNSLQLSITNSSLHGRLSEQWLEQFCLAIMRRGNAKVLFEPIDILSQLLRGAERVCPLVELPAHHASTH